jgi:hypothetical protein
MGVLSGQVKVVYLNHALRGWTRFVKAVLSAVSAKCQLPVFDWLLTLRANRQSLMGNRQSAI